VAGTHGSFGAKDLAGCELFAGLTPCALDHVFRAGRVRDFPRHMTVFSQGARAERAHVVLRGRVRITQGDPHGGLLVIRFIGPGETFGTLGLYTNHIYPATAVSVTEVVEMSWSEADLGALIAAYPGIAINLVRIAGQRLHEAQERLRELATQRVAHRIAHVLLRLAAQAGDTSDKGTSISFPIGRKDVAEMCGATLHTVSRTFRSWEKAGLLSTSRQQIIVSDLERLKRLTS
jgi:CRP-like cAMP-binding protein